MTPTTTSEWPPRATLADLGGEEAADALAAGIDGLEGEEQVHAVEALAWLRDPRAIERLHELVPEQLGEPVPPRYRRGVVSLLARIGSRADVLRMADEAVTAITAGTGSFRDQRIADDLWLALHRERPELMQEVGDRLRDAVPELPALARWPGNERAPRVTFVEPHGERVVPRVTLAELSDTPVPGSSSPPAKFGGQPDWVAEPTWPLGAEFTPLVFYGQLPAGPGRMAYIFIDPEGRHWEPLGEANAVVIQPGARCHLETAPLSAGPQLFEHYAAGDGFRHRRRARPYERFIRLEEGADPECWDWPELAPNTYPTNPPGDWNKLGGTPLFLQGEEHPPGEGWLYAFQFTAGWAGRELGDGAECYGFIREDGSGAFLWQCH